MFRETRLVESHSQGRPFPPFVVHLFELGRWNVADWLESPSIVEPVDPFKGRECNLLQASPRSIGRDYFCLEEAEDRLGHGVVLRVSDAADRRRDAALASRSV